MMKEKRLALNGVTGQLRNTSIAYLQAYLTLLVLLHHSGSAYSMDTPLEPVTKMLSPIIILSYAAAPRNDTSPLVLGASLLRYSIGRYTVLVLPQF